jgi:hypothetical protein
MPKETKAMLSNTAQPATTAEVMAKKIAEAIKLSGVRPIDIANACGRSKQAVQGWIKTGRIDKMHLPKLAELTKLPLEWWLNSEQPSANDLPQHGAHALARLQVIGQQLSASDWHTLIQVAQQLASKQRPGQEDPKAIAAAAKATDFADAEATINLTNAERRDAEKLLEAARGADQYLTGIAKKHAES